MRLFAVAMVAMLGLVEPAAARDPLTGLVDSFFNYRVPPPPVGGNCAAIAAENGPDGTWFGTFSGKRYTVNDRYIPFAAQGCFESGLACHFWQQQAINYADGPISYMGCRRGVPRGARG